ncbi:MAG: hypothetical protein MUE75_16600 [Algoriphagus sp.]|nr:hypothetical protein [Algoriphagus sp.]
MRSCLHVFLFFCIVTLASCEEEIEPIQVANEKDFQPLVLGNFWVYEVDEMIYFGENDAESSKFFYRDRVRSSYVNAEREIVFIVERSKSTDRKIWSKVLEYTLQVKDNALVRTVNNQAVVTLNFPLELGKKWNGNAYRANEADEFEIDSVATETTEGKTRIQVARVNQEELDDKITQRDIRYEIYERGIGLLEKYDEVLTYCSRNNCLGLEVIDGGFRIKMKLVEYEVR